jgi:hypothetical protein
MHIDYAKELVEHYEADSQIQGDSFVILSTVATEAELLALIEQHGDDKHRSIAATVREIQGANNRYRKVTSAQKAALARHLLDLFGTARAALAAAFATTEQEMFGEAAGPSAAQVAKVTGERHAAAAAEALQKAQFMGLATLKGSPKQIAWAEQVRQNYIVWAEENDIDPMVVIGSPAARQARFWIDNRHSFRGL